MKILLSPAKSLDYKSTIESPFVSNFVFQKESKQLIKQLQKLNSKKIQDLMHISLDLAELNVDRFKKWEISTEITQNNQPCAYIFNGEAYKGLSFSSFNEVEIERAQNQLRILSGLYGILKPLDLIAPYRLEMGTKLKINEKTPNLYRFWGDKITKHLEKEEKEFIVNLASNEYSKVIQFDQLTAKTITPVFKEFENGTYKMVMMYAKHARGQMANYILKNNLQHSEAIKNYDLDGYRFDENQSTDKEWVFTR